MPGPVSITFAAGYLCGPDRFAGLHSGNVAAHSLRVPFPWRGRPYRVVPRQHDVTLPHCREVQRLCCDRWLPCRLLGSALRAHQHAELQPVPQRRRERDRGQGRSRPVAEGRPEAVLLGAQGHGRG